MHNQLQNLILSTVIQNYSNESNSQDSDTLKLIPIALNEDYRKKWNIHEHDFVVLTKNGELLRDTLYRVGGPGANLNNNYFMLLKHVEAFYEDSITTDKLKKPHLESRWCILDKMGVEKVVFDYFKSPYLVKDSVLYSIDQEYYNIETGYYYGYASTSMNSKEYLFLDCQYDKDENKNGIIKIDKNDGTWELIP